MKLFKQSIIAATTTFVSILPVQASNNSIIELTFVDSQIQCGANAPQLEISANVYHNGTLIKEKLSVGDSILVPSLDGLTMTYEAVNAGCSLAKPTEFHLTKALLSKYYSWFESKAGAYEQDSVISIMNGLPNYKDLYLVELGSTNPSSKYFDLQDAIFIVNNNPQVFSD